MQRMGMIVLLLVFLFSSTAVPTHAATTVIPKIHRQGDEGFFSAALPLPENVDLRWMWLVARPEDGDVFMVYVKQPTIVDGKPQGTDMILTGRYGKPGKATIVITGKDTLNPTAAFKPIMTVRLNLPGSATPDPEVMKTWANSYRGRLASAAYCGGDSFAGYWNMAAAGRYGLQPSEGMTQMSRNRMEEQPDVYDIFTGAAAIQESLQLEVLGSRPARNPAQPVSKSTGTNSVTMASLAGPSVKSHPFAAMLKGRSPKVPALAALIPADQYAVFFADINKQIELSDLMEEWGGSLLETIHASSRDFKLRKKLTQQLCLETGTLTRLFGDRVIGAMAFTGNDPFLKEGSDFTVLFALKDRDLFLKQIEKRYSEAVAARKASRSEFSSGGKKHLSVTTFDRRVSSYTVILGDVAVVSNSVEAMNRIIQASTGKTQTLADALDLKYMRTIFPEGDRNEDVFIYLSDAHIRKLVGPVVKIEEARRMTCAANLQVLANARFWYRSERKREPTLQNLRDEGYLGTAHLSCPDGGNYALDKAGGEPTCSVHNRIGYLTPLTAIKAGSPTEREQAQYRAFVENYNRYWRQFFDPIGIRIKMGETVRIETCILPLIENSWYDGLVAFSGREPGLVSDASVLPRTIVSLRGHVSREWLAKTEFMKDITNTWGLATNWLGDDFSLNLCDGPVLFTVEGRAAGFLGREAGRGSMEPLVIGYILSAVNLPTYLSVKVTDPEKAEQLLPAIFLTSMARHSGPDGFSSEAYSQEAYHGKKISVLSFSLVVAKLRLYCTVVGDRLIIASRRDIVTDLIDASTNGKTAPGNVEFSVYRTAFNQIEPVVSLGYQEDIRHACHKNLALVEVMLGWGNVSPDEFKTAAFALRGYEPYCPGGGRYSLDPETNRATCSIHGTVWKPMQPVRSPDDSPLMKTVNSLKKINARLSFTPEGVMATVELQRGK